MKKELLFLIILVLGACASLLLPYSTITSDFTQIRIQGYQYPLALVSLLILITITILAFTVSSKGMHVVTLLLSLSNVFFSFFMLIFLTLYDTSVETTEIQLGTGIYTNCLISILVLVTMAIRTMKELRSK